MEILPGIHWIKGVIGCNCWLVIEPGLAIIVDTGSPGNAHRIAYYLKKHGAAELPLHIVLTHGDIDHGGSAAELKKLAGGSIAVHQAEKAFLNERRNLPGPFRWVSKIFPRLSRTAEVEPDVLLNEGDRIGGFQVVHTPGHTPGSICLWEPGKLIFTGDALRTHSGDKMLTPSRPTAKDMPLAMGSLRKIADLDFDALFGGHGPPVIGKAGAKLRRMVSALPSE